MRGREPTVRSHWPIGRWFSSSEVRAPLGLGGSARANPSHLIPFPQPELLDCPVSAVAGRLTDGEVAEWLKALVSKTSKRKFRGFESRPLRHEPQPIETRATTVGTPTDWHGSAHNVPFRGLDAGPPTSRRGAGVVEQARLDSVSRSNPFVGSKPTLSAITSVPPPHPIEAIVGRGSSRGGVSARHGVRCYHAVGGR